MSSSPRHYKVLTAAARGCRENFVMTRVVIFHLRNSSAARVNTSTPMGMASSSTLKWGW